MNLQISFDLTDLKKSIEIAKEVEDYADIIEVGAILIYKYGVHAIKEFRANLHKKTILADSKIVDRSKEITTVLAEAGCDWITVMSGTRKSVIQTAAQTAHQFNKKIMLDIVDAQSQGQSALEAKTLGMDAILFHQQYDEENKAIFMDNWELVRGNTDLPIYVSAMINRKNIENLLELKPEGLVIGKSIVDADNPKEEAKFYYELCKR